MRALHVLASIALLLAAGCTSTPREVDVVRSGVVAGAGDTYYEVSGAGPAIVLVHGGFGDRRMWDDHVASLAEDHRVVRYDLRGFGRTPTPRAAYSPVDDLRRVLDELGVERATIVGNSMGGALAIDFALVHPERVEGIALVAAGLGGFPSQEERPEFAADLDAMNTAFETAAREGPARGVELWMQSPMVVVASRDPATSAKLRTMITDNAGIFALEHWPFEPLDPPAARRLGDVRVPTLVVAGGRDTPLMLAAARRTAAGIRDAELVVIESADHLPQMVAPREFRDALDDLLARVAKRRR